MDSTRTQLDHISEVTASIYTLSITTKENKFRSNMRRLREMLMDETKDASIIDRSTLSGILWFAVLDRDESAVRELLKYNPDANYMRSQINMLWMAIIRGDVEIAKMLIEAGANVNERIPEDGPSFLHFLVTTTSDDYENILELVKIMIEHGADVNASVDGCSVLRTAVKHETLPFVEILLKNGAKVKGVDVVLMAAKSSKADELLPMIVDAIEDDSQRLEWIFGAMQQFIEDDDDDLEAIKALLNLELSVLSLDIEGWTILNIAVHFGSIEVVKLLLEKGADINLRSGDGNFPLYWAASYELSSMAEFLIDNGASVNECNDQGRTALHSACKNASAANIDLLLRSGADINVTDDDGVTPFSLMNVKYLGDAHKVIIKHVATLVSRDSHVNESDMERIRKNPVMSAYYDKYLDELRKKE